MREAFGGTFVIKLILVFIIIYVSFMAVAISYAKAFRVKNGVINIVEQYQFGGFNDSNTIDEIDKYLEKVSYDFSGKTSLIDYCNDLADSEETEDKSIYTIRGACIVPRGDTSGIFYEVVTFIYIELPFLNIHMTIPIRGETKIISV